MVMNSKFYTSVVAAVLFTTTVQAAPSLGKDYADLKNWLNNKYGFDYSLTYSIMAQRSSPAGKYNAVQSYFTPAFTWTNFDNKYGTGALNFSYNSVFYGNHTAQDIQSRSGMVTPINDFDGEGQEFANLYYTYQLPGKYDWLTIGAGQYGISMFDGTAYDNDQQINFIGYAASQNATSTYSTAGLGAYLQATPGRWSFVVGAQDATNISAPSIRFNHLNDEHYTTFGLIGYNPHIKGLGEGQYSVLVYNQPYVNEQRESTTGWSINMSQDMGDKFSVFARINGVNGNISSIEQSYVAGMVYNNPLNRNSLDQIGLSYSYNKIDENAVGSEIYHDAEQVIEAYWAWGISRWATITPDFQFYINPALNKKSDYGTSASLRLTLFF